MAILSGLHQALRLDLLDLRYNWFPRQASGDVVVVAIDAASIQRVGVWPWPRDIHAALLKKLEAANVRDMAFDVDFSSRSNDVSDHALAEALKNAGGSAILPIFQQRANADAQHRMIVSRPIEKLHRAAWGALVNIGADTDGVVRRYSYGEMIDGEFVPSMAALLAGSSKSDPGTFRIDYSIRPGSIPVISYANVLDGSPSVLSLLRDKRVLVGGTSIELGDRFTVPNGRIIPGPLLQALAAESILQGRELRLTAPWLGALLVLGLIALMVLLRRRSLAVRFFVLVGLAVGVEAAAVMIQAQFAIVLDTSLFAIAIGLYLAVGACEELDIRRIIGQIADSRFSRITMTLGDGVVCTDTRGHVTVWNRAAASIFGREAADVIGKPVDFLLESDNAPFRYKALPQTGLLAAGGLMVEALGRRKDGDIFSAEVCVSAWRGTEGLQYGLVVRDISARKREAAKMRYLAEYDTLTGLTNRHSLNTELERKIEAAAARGTGAALLFVDLDTFKEVNDTLGHAAGDMVLVEVAARLKALSQEGDVVARIGGDEFALIVAGEPADIRIRAELLAKRILSAFTASLMSLEGRDVPIRGSIGIALYPDHGLTAQDLLSNADLALYRAKAEGRQRSICFDPSFRDALEKRVRLEAELKRALERGEFELFYQPKVSLQTGAVVGAEALIRWRHPERGVLPPAEFIGVVNASSISTVVALWVLQTAAAQAYAWQAIGKPIRVSCNLSPSLIHSGLLIDAVSQLLHETGPSPELLELEVTEDIVLVNEEQALSTFRQIQKLGVRIAFDDFGTGYASLSYLKKFPLDILKIDRSFVSELCKQHDDTAIVAATIGLGKQFNLSVIAEGIEDAETAAILYKMGCDEGQGYYFGKPMPASQFEASFLGVEPVRREPSAEPARDDREAAAA